MIVVTVLEVEELNSKLVSDRAKVREEGLKTLQGYLNYTSADLNLWSLLDSETAASDESRIRSSSWPGVLHALCVCIENEVASSKKKAPKPLLAKALRNFIAKAEDLRNAGQSLRLLRKVKRLFQHVAQTLERVPTFVSDYNNVLYQLLPVFDYRMRMGKKIYADLLHFYFDKAKDVSRSTKGETSIGREEGFRNISTLLCLLQHPPGDLPEVLLKDITQDFVDIFRHLGDEGRIANKLLAALNCFIVGNGLNIGENVAYIHQSVRPFMARMWLTTRDRELKDGLVLYARAQLNLRHILLPDDLDEVSTLWDLLDLLEKDLDQIGTSVAGIHRVDAGRQDRAGVATKSMRSLFELAAVVFFEAGKRLGSRASNASKRRKKADVNNLIKDRLAEGRYMWGGAFCLLVRRSGTRLAVPCVINWLNGVASSLDKIVLEGVTSRSFEGPIWILRCLQELATLWGQIVCINGVGNSQMSLSEIQHGEGVWKGVWDALLHWLPLLSNVQVMVEEIFRLMALMASQGCCSIGNVSQEFWDLYRFAEPPSGDLLYFMASFFASRNSQVGNVDLEIRKKLLEWCLSSLGPQDVHRARFMFGEQLSPRLFTAAVVALTFGVIPGTTNFGETFRRLKKELSWPSCEREPYLEPDESELVQEGELTALDRSDVYLAPTGLTHKNVTQASTCTNYLPRAAIEVLLNRVTQHLVKAVSVASDDTQPVTLSQLLHLGTILTSCVQGVNNSIERWAPPAWCSKGVIWDGLRAVFGRVITTFSHISKESLAEHVDSPLLGSPSVDTRMVSSVLTFTPSTFEILEQLVSAVQICATSLGESLDAHAPFRPFLMKLLKASCTAFSSANEATAEDTAGSNSKLSENRNVTSRIIDSDLDVHMDPGVRVGSNAGDPGSSTVFGMDSIAREKSGDLKCSLLRVITTVGKVMPEETCGSLVDLLSDEKIPKTREDILSNLCKTIKASSCEFLTVVVQRIHDYQLECEQSESMRYFVLAALDSLFSSLLSFEDGVETPGSCQRPRNMDEEFLSGQVSSLIADLLSKIIDMGLLFWKTRVKVVGAISQFLVLNPSAAQVLMEKFMLLLKDPEYHVRICVVRKVAVLFETWDGHEELLQEVCGSFGVKVATITTEGKFSTGDILDGGQELMMAETALLSLGEIAIASENAENDVVFIICAFAALNPPARSLACAVLNRVGNQLGYSNRFQFMAQLLGHLLTHWVVANINVSRLLEVRKIIADNPVEHEFLQLCCPWVLPWLMYYGRRDQIQWLATALDLSTPVLVKQHFESIFSALMPPHMDPDKSMQRRANLALRVTMLELADFSEDDRDALIQKRMVQIVGSLIGLCCERENPQLPYFPKTAIIQSIKTVVDNFVDSDEMPHGEYVVDKMETFRPDRVFTLLLELHFELSAASHPRHCRNLLTSIAVLLHVLGMRAVVPSTTRYLIHIILQSMEVVDLQKQCCDLIAELLDRLDASGLESSKRVLGEQLQSIVSKLVSCCLHSHGEENCKRSGKRSSTNDFDQKAPASVIMLLNRLTVDGVQTLKEYIKDLDPFPDIPCFEPMQTLRNTLISKPTLAEEFVKYVRKATRNSLKVRLFSTKKLCNQLHTRRDELYALTGVPEWHTKNGWRCSAIVVIAVWKLVQLCDKHDDLDMINLAGQFLAAVGVGNPHAVVFHLPDSASDSCAASTPQTFSGDSGSESIVDVSNDSKLGLPDGLVSCIISQLRSYLVDSSVQVIQLASHSLKGILSTEKGQRVFLSMSQQEKTYLEVYSRGVNLKLVKEMVDSHRKKSSELAIPLDDLSIWQTSGKSYDFWVCKLTYSLVERTNDTILRLCQDVLFVKAALAELVFPHVFGALAGENDPGSDLCVLISKQVEDHIFNEENQSTRSVRLFLNTLNCLRQCYIHSGMKGVSAIWKRKERPKVDKSSGSSGGSGVKRTRQRHSSTRTGNAPGIAASGGPVLDDSQSFWNKVYWLNIDYLSTARAAQQCAAYFSSVMYIEHWCEESFGSLTLGPPDSSSDTELPLHLELLVRVYTRINEPDGVYGVIRSHKVGTQLLRYEHEGNWSQALKNYDLLLRTATPNQHRNFHHMLNTEAPREQSFSSNAKLLQNWQLHKGLMRSLQQDGCSHVLELYRSGLSQQDTGLGFDAEFKEMQYEAAWRAGCWDGINATENIGTNLKSPDTSSATKELCFHAHLYSSLKSLVEGDGDTFFSSLMLARKEIITHIAHTSMESTQNVNPLIVKLQMLDCVSNAWEMRWSVQNQYPLAIVPSGNLKAMVNGPLVPSKEQIMMFESTWEENLKQMQANYEMAEPYIAIHKVLLESLNLRDLIPEHLLRFGQLSRKAGRLNHAGNAIHELKCISTQTVGTSDSNIEHPLQAAVSKYFAAGRVEEAKILWAEGHQEMAINLAKYVLHLERDESASALLLCLTGKWLADTRSSSSRIILDSYLKRAVELCKSGAVGEDNQRSMTMACRAHFRLAHYADALYRNHQERLMSSEWQAALRLRQHKAREYEALKARLGILKADPTEDPTKIREYSMKVVELHKQLSFDIEEAQRLQDDKDHFLGIALENYSSCLCISSKYDLRVVFRLISMWFSLSTNEVVMEAMLETVEKVQSYKFLPLVYQIASRLCTYKDSYKDLQGSHGFQKSLNFLLRKMANEHPYHSLYQLFALANGDRIKEKQRGKNVFVVDMDKKRAAEELLQSLPSQHHQLLSQVRRMIEIYIQLAEMETTPKDANRKLPIPREIRSTRELRLVPVVTASIQVDTSCQYPQDSFPHFSGFSEGIKVMNGINAPKYIECLGSDGMKYRQLAKSGNDDLRQDAVMEQLFGLVNNLLQDHPHTRKRDLKVRTYKVVPFTPSAGVLEWVDGTLPLGEYLLGSNRLGGAHLRYGGDDWSFLKCREHMCTVKDKRTGFETVLQNFHPVMHNFFLESFAQAENWFEKRLAYTRSVATSSMVGYIVGLGDRHSMNVLLDQASAEVIHIDLGVAFEQGLMLKTPERIPFRLTRDIIDGMGVTGVEGIFRRCCEATLSVLRTNKESLLTIIEVFIHDPLYNWALSPLKALQRQQDVEEIEESSPDTANFVDMEGNKDAARALFRVKQKLDGYEEGEMRSLQGQVQQLIQDAQDPERLSQLFPGWGAWV